MVLFLGLKCKWHSHSGKQGQAQCITCMAMGQEAQGGQGSVLPVDTLHGVVVGAMANMGAVVVVVVMEVVVHGVEAIVAGHVIWVSSVITGTTPEGHIRDLRMCLRTTHIPHGEDEGHPGDIALRKHCKSFLST